MQRDVVTIVGSLRRGSFNRMAAKAFAAVAPASLKLEIVEIGELSFYSEDVEAAGATPQWTAFRQRIARADAVLFVTPEYNRSIPGVLKNAIDVGSRPYGKSAWAKKPVAVASVTPGAVGGFGANHHLRQCLVFLDMPPLQQPEVYISGASKLFDANGALTNDSTRDLLKTFMQAFAEWIEKTAQPHK